MICNYFTIYRRTYCLSLLELSTWTFSLFLYRFTLQTELLFSFLFLFLAFFEMSKNRMTLSTASPFNIVLRKSLSKTAAASGILHVVRAHLLAVHISHAQEIDTDNVSETGVIAATKPVQRFQNHDHPCNADIHLVFICSVTITASFKSFTYPYKFVTNEEVPEMLGDIFLSFLDARNSQSMNPATAGLGSSELQTSGP